MWGFLKDEGNSRALAIIVTLTITITITITIIGAVWAAFTHFLSQPQQQYLYGYVDAFSIGQPLNAAL